MAKINKKPPAEDWQQLELLFTSPEQANYELIRTIVLYRQSAAERARQTGKPARTINHLVKRFVAEGMAGLFVKEPFEKDLFWTTRLPDPIRAYILSLKSEYGGFSVSEISRLAQIRFGRKPDWRTVAKVLNETPLAFPASRRFPPYHQMPVVEGRQAILTLYKEGWNVKSIATYLGISRPTVYATLDRLPRPKEAGAEHPKMVTFKKDEVEKPKGVGGGEKPRTNPVPFETSATSLRALPLITSQPAAIDLENRSHARKDGVRKVDFTTIELIRKLQLNEKIGRFRIYAALEQKGIDISQRTCGRIMARNREIARLEAEARGEEEEKKTPKTMPFKADHRHQYWSVDVRYIEKNKMGDKPVYVLSILENYSRSILASRISPTQNTGDFLQVLYEAVTTHGLPQTLVSDSGSIFLSHAAKAIYATLGIKKVEIAKKQSWQNLIEANWGVQRRMADYYFEQAPTWEALVAAHENWMFDFNYQEHWAHQARPKHRRSPAAVLSWVRGQLCEQFDLEMIFFGRHYSRKLSRIGYVRFRDWRIYGELGLAQNTAQVHLRRASLTIEYKEEALADYTSEFEKEGYFLSKVEFSRLYATAFRSPQLSLWTEKEVVWRKAFKVAKYAARKKPARTSARQLELPFFLEKTG